MVREPTSPNLTPTQADSNLVPIDTTPYPPRSSQKRAVSKEAPVPKGPVLPRRTPTPLVSTTSQSYFLTMKTVGEAPTMIY